MLTWRYPCSCPGYVNTTSFWYKVAVCPTVNEEVLVIVIWTKGVFRKRGMMSRNRCSCTPCICCRARAGFDWKIRTKWLEDRFSREHSRGSRLRSKARAQQHHQQQQPQQQHKRTSTRRRQNKGEFLLDRCMLPHS